MKNVWFTSDWHFGHSSLLKWCADTRRGNDIDEHDELLIESMNSIIKPGDDLYVLGDVSFRNLTNTIELLSKLKVKPNIILGNHDMVFINNIDKFKDVVNSIEYVKLAKMSDVLVHLSHFPVAEWWNMHRGSYMLHGHSHGRNYVNMNTKHRIFDVGIDNRDDNEMLPFHLDELITKLKDREIITYNRS